MVKRREEEEEAEKINREKTEFDRIYILLMLVKQATCTYISVCVRLTKEKKLGNEKCASNREIHIHTHTHTHTQLMCCLFVDLSALFTHIHTYIYVCIYREAQCTRQHQAQIDEKKI